MKSSKKRGFLLKAGAMLAAVTLAFSPTPAQAEDLAMNSMPETSNLIITKVEQGADKGTPTNGEKQTITGNTIEGVTFEAYQVPLTEAPGTESWQQEIAGTDLAEAQGAIDSDAAVKSGTTNDSGVVTFNDLARGLYLIRETKTPAGVVRSGDFLVAVPQTNAAGTAWLSDIYVYPKNHTVDATKTVENATDYKTGDVVTWTITADIPQVRDPLSGDFVSTEMFVITDLLNDSELTPTSDSPIKVLSPENLDFDTDYKVNTTVPVEGQTLVTVTFTDAGRAKIADALPGTQQVVVTLDTVVNASGVIDNTAFINHGTGSEYNTDTDGGGTPEIRYGDITVIKSDENNTRLEGAQFRVYLTQEAAQAAADVAYSDTDPNGYLTPASNTSGLWTTGEDGTVKIAGLRDSSFANGGAVAEQLYWLVETQAPAGHQLLAEPVSFTVNGKDLSLTLNVSNASNTGNGFQLPLTGGTGTALLTILGIAILGLVLFVARMRRNGESA
ncbi:type 1 fimbrial protein [Corynebacterium deserti GIMN1.010]|uniref:Type 1 fimbrial protein n=1 Tax=Corynebacterium deserti GIMN1.010 TaxID=931089 RepID=A0A0M4CYW9_9CORY|nr:SpaH/EbpB family LPXTG-anchored major pilin [Corynebacterium deserti]ALC06687.1 type 1 fimbrial protein [Corynebacterium deserti GIMN1.010]